MVRGSNFTSLKGVETISWVLKFFRISGSESSSESASKTRREEEVEVDIEIIERPEPEVIIVVDGDETILDDGGEVVGVGNGEDSVATSDSKVVAEDKGDPTESKEADEVGENTEDGAVVEASDVTEGNFELSVDRCVASWVRVSCNRAGFSKVDSKKGMSGEDGKVVK